MIVVPGLFSRGKRASVNFTTLAQGRGLAVLAGWQTDLNVTLNAGNVSSILDQSGNGNTLSQVTPANQPLYTSQDGTLSGKPSTTLDGVNDFLQSTANLPAGPLCVYSVMQQVTWTIDHELWSAGSGDNYTLAMKSSSPNLASYNGVLSSLNSGAPVGTWVRTIQTFTNSTADIVKIGSTQVSGVNLGLADPSANWYIGRASGSGLVANMKWAMQLIITQIPSGSDFTALDAAVTQMYGAGVLV